MKSGGGSGEDESMDVNGSGRREKCEVEARLMEINVMELRQGDETEGSVERTMWWGETYRYHYRK